MAKAPGKDPVSDMQDEYDLTELEGGTRGKYADRIGKGSNLVLLQPDVAAAFPDSESVNKALRELMRVASRVKSKAEANEG